MGRGSETQLQVGENWFWNVALQGLEEHRVLALTSMKDEWLILEEIHLVYSLVIWWVGIAIPTDQISWFKHCIGYYKNKRDTTPRELKNNWSIGWHRLIYWTKNLSHWPHDVVTTLNQRQWRWFNFATTSCAQWVCTLVVAGDSKGQRPCYDKLIFSYE